MQVKNIYASNNVCMQNVYVDSNVYMQNTPLDYNVRMQIMYAKLYNGTVTPKEAKGEMSNLSEETEGARRPSCSNWVETKR